MPVKELFRLSRFYQNISEDRDAECALWQAHRERLKNQGYHSVAIVEQDGEIGMYVLLSSERVLSITEMAHPSYR
jgi:hypothetical protein